MRLATRRLFAIYLVVAGTALLFPHRTSWWPLLAVIHIVAIALLLKPDAFTWFSRRVPRTARVIGDWYILILIPGLYTELATLNQAIYNGHYFDSIILFVEHHVFGQPSTTLARAMPWLPLSEFLHFSYLSYYLIIYGPALVLYLRGRRDIYQQLLFNLMLTFFAHYIFFIYFPVQGPRYLFPAPSGNISHGFFYNIAHKVLEAGSARGAAFPSSHVGVSFSQTAFVFTVLPRLAPFVLLLSTGLAFGAVYGGFHYATDACCGLIYGLLLFWIAPRVAAWLGRTST